jgi:hypothetical protein
MNRMLYMCLAVHAAHVCSGHLKTAIPGPPAGLEQLAAEGLIDRLIYGWAGTAPGLLK